MEIQIKNEKPPEHIWKRAHALFDIDDKRTVYTYGNIIYNPAGVFLDEEIQNHESVHVRQQEQTEGGPDAWWERYFTDAAFRFAQEAQAYARQYLTYCINNKDRNDQTRYLYKIASILSGPMYAVDVSLGETTRLIKAFSGI